MSNNYFVTIKVLHGDVGSTLLDVLNVIDHETIVNDNQEERQKLCSIIKELETWLGDSLIKERLEVDTLQDCSILKAKKIFYTRFIKTKTKLFYKQQKFNLFREESEGYAKLITELNQEIEDSITPTYLLQVRKLESTFVQFHINFLFDNCSCVTGCTVVDRMFQFGSQSGAGCYSRVF